MLNVRDFWFEHTYVYSLIAYLLSFMTNIDSYTKRILTASLTFYQTSHYNKNNHNNNKSGMVMSGSFVYILLCDFHQHHHRHHLFSQIN